jgi:hypothetical protein
MLSTIVIGWEWEELKRGRGPSRLRVNKLLPYNVTTAMVSLG